MRKAYRCLLEKKYNASNLKKPKYTIHLVFNKNTAVSSFNKKKERLVNSMNFRQHQVLEATRSNLTDIVFTDHHTSLLNLGPKFVPTEKKIPFMEIITATKSLALNLGYPNKEADGESYCHILNKNRNIKIKDKLSKEQPKALKEIRKINNNTKVYRFDKGSGFVVLSE